MADQEIRSTSVEYVRAAVAANRDDVHSGTVEFAFTTAEDDDAAAYTAGEWFSAEKSIELVDGKYQPAFVAQVLAGGPAATVPLAAGEYFGWIRITVGEQSIVKLFGKVKVT